MSHALHNQAKLLTRVRKISGQSAALEKMLLADNDCQDILQQIAAIRGAVNGLMNEVLEHHIVEHLGAAATDASAREADLQLVLKALRSYLK